MDSTGNVDYVAVIADLERQRTALDSRRVALDQAIDAIRKLISDSVPPEPPHDVSISPATAQWIAAGGVARRHRSPKLTSEQVELIKARNEAGKSQKEMAEEFGVSRATIWGVLSGRRRVKGSVEESA